MWMLCDEYEILRSASEKIECNNKNFSENEIEDICAKCVICMVKGLKQGDIH